LRDGNQALAAIWYDKLQQVYLQTQVQARMMEQQLMQIAQGLPIQPLEGLLNKDQSFRTIQMDGMNQSANPANGAVPFAQMTGVGNAPAPDAGYNTTAPRNRDTGLVDPTGSPLFG